MPWDERPEGTAQCTSVGLGRHLRDWLSENDVRPESDFRCEPGGELIVLKGARRFYSKGTSLETYPDSQTTRAMRDQIFSLNLRLNSFAMAHSGEGVDLASRQLRRIFNNGRFDQGGRLYGGFWQAMKKEQRCFLQIDGEPIATLDYGQAFARMLYGLEGVEPPKGDLYALPGMPAKARPGVKLVFSSLLFSATEPKRLPRDARKKGGIPKGVSMRDLAEGLRSKHPAIAHYLPSDAGYRLFHLESEILLSVLEECSAQGIPALPIHDAILVPQSKQGPARAIMEAAFRGKVGVEGSVGITLYTHPTATLS